MTNNNSSNTEFNNYIADTLSEFSSTIRRHPEGKPEFYLQLAANLFEISQAIRQHPLDTQNQSGIYQNLADNLSDLSDSVHKHPLSDQDQSSFYQTLAENLSDLSKSLRDHKVKNSNRTELFQHTANNLPELSRAIRSYPINKKEFNRYVRIASDHLNSRDGKQKIDRRDMEQALAPALFDGKAHAVVINELKSAPKTAEGVLAKHITEENRVEFNTKLNHLYESIAMHNLTDTNIKFFLEDFRTQVSQVTDEELAAGDIPAQLQFIPDHLVELANKLQGDARPMIKITGVDKAVFVGTTGTGQHLAKFHVASSTGKSIEWQVGYRKHVDGDLDAISVTSADVHIDGKEISEWLRSNDTPENLIEEGCTIVERILQGLTACLVMVNTPDINNKLKLSPELAQMLINELL
ncbi:hypothetical protein OTK49_20960 [Vibrio coralliirubri]|uniref:hypothetical protein n=1 Tax=Vibrio coralliirubri TaxID=1516159 RepID=UPI0022841557|nr:hypothetical protein [Vibrio coralliirubri]MCY9864990.1 hypothetical protein [Vibrio coralliirubri]